MSESGYYTSGQFARMAHISIRTVRYYDEVNILKPSHVNESGKRFYSEEDFVRLQQILLLKYLGFSLDDIRMLTIEDTDFQMLRHSLELQQKLVRDRIEQMELVEQAIGDTAKAIENNKNVDWSQMLRLIHLTNMESSMKSQYQNSTNISARINLHRLYSVNPQGWFPWVYEQCGLFDGACVLELGCGNGALWKENFSRLPQNIDITLNDISEGMLRDTRRELELLEGETGPSHFQYAGFDCHEIPYADDSFDCVVANHVLFYCEDIRRVIGEVCRVLKSEGCFVCSAYGRKHMIEITRLVQAFNDRITLSAEALYEQFGLENGGEILREYFPSVSTRLYEDELVVNQPEPMIEYILSCHGNQNQYILDRYKDFRAFVEKKTRRGFHITKQAGVFVCKKL